MQQKITDDFKMLFQPNSKSQPHIDLTTQPALRYSNKQSVLINIQTDADFIKDILEIAKKKKATSGSIFQAKHQITDKQCQQIHQKATKHAYANIFNSTTVLDQKKIQDSIMCNCGCNRGAGQQLPIFMNQQNLTFLGPGVLLYFFYLRHIRYTIVLGFMIYGAFQLLANIISFSQHPKQPCSNFTDSFNQLYCNYDLMSTSDNSRNYDTLYTIQLWLGMVFSIVWVFSVRLIKYLGQLKDKHIDELLDSASDYTIRIQNLPFGGYQEEQLYEYLKQLWATCQENEKSISPSQSTGTLMNKKKDSSLKIKSIQIVYNMQKCRQLLNQIQIRCFNLTSLFQLNLNHKYNNVINMHQVDQYKSQKKTLIKKFQELESLRRKFISDSQFRKSLATTCALVQFLDDSQQSQFLQHLGHRSNNALIGMFTAPKQHNFKGTKVTISRAPQPSDLNWVNCEKPFSFFRYGMIWLITFFMLGCSFATVSFLQTTDLVKKGNTILIAIILQLVNRMIWNTLSELVVYEYNNTKTDAIMSLMKKSVLAQAANIILGPMIAKFINNKDIYGQDGLASISLCYQFVMFGLMWIYYIWNPIYLTKLLIIKTPYLRKKMINYLSHVVGQIDTIDQIRPVLEFYQEPAFPIAGCYVYMTTAIFHTMFFCNLQPTILLVLIINITGFYYATKYLLFRMAKIPQLTQLQVFQFAAFCATTGIAFFCAGNLFFQILYFFENDQDINFLKLTPSSIGLIFWLIGVLNPCEIFDKFNEWIINDLGYGKRLFSNKQKKMDSKVDKVQSILNKMLMQSNFFQNRLTKRRQLYYKYSHVNKLLQLQDELKQMQNKDGFIKKNRAMQFCEGFFKREQSYKKKRFRIQRSSGISRSRKKSQLQTQSQIQKIQQQQQMQERSQIIFIPVTRVQRDDNEQI